MVNRLGMNISKVAMGYSGEGETKIVNLPCSASLAFTNQGGKWVDYDGSKDLQLATSASTTLVGWAKVGEFTASSTAGATRVDVDQSLDSSYWMKADAAVTESLVQSIAGLTTDAAGNQIVDVTSPAQNTLTIMEVDVQNQRVKVQNVALDTTSL